ncbi:MAG: SWIB/MDM2 domain-containing protein [candidate division WOR-3 bacterium]
MPAKKAFGGLKIKVDDAWKAICGPKREVGPAEMTKLLWAYVKKHKLLAKGKGKQFGGMVIKTDAALKAIYGKAELKPSELAKGMWAYIKKHNLRVG